MDGTRPFAPHLLRGVWLDERSRPSLLERKQLYRWLAGRDEVTTGARGRDFARGSCFWKEAILARGHPAELARQETVSRDYQLRRTLFYKQRRTRPIPRLLPAGCVQAAETVGRCSMQGPETPKGGDGKCISPATIKTESQTAASRRGPSHKKAERHPESPLTGFIQVERVLHDGLSRARVE